MPATSPSVPSIERKLQAARRRKARTEQLDAEAAAERDEVIRSAIAAKIPRARIVELVGLSPQRIDQIRRGARL